MNAKHIHTDRPCILNLYFQDSRNFRNFAALHGSLLKSSQGCFDTTFFTHEGEHQIALNLGADDSIGDNDWKQMVVGILAEVIKGNIGNDNPLFPTADRVIYVVADETFQHGIILLKYEGL